MLKKTIKPQTVGKHSNKVVGDYGEKIAVKFLRKNGYKILKTNYKTEYGEIDIIAKDKDYLVFIEVKYRSNLKYGYPSEAVDERKQNQLRKLAYGFLTSKHLLWSLTRIDVVEILGDEIKLYKNAF